MENTIMNKSTTAVTVGQRIRLVKTNDKWTDLKKHDYVGTVYEINRVDFDGGFTQIWCAFENGANFAIVPEIDDEYEILS